MNDQIRSRAKSYCILAERKKFIKCLTSNKLPSTISPKPNIKILFVISWNEGIIFNSEVEIFDENKVKKFFESYDIFKFCSHDDMIAVIILQDIVIAEIPLKY